MLRPSGVLLLLLFAVSPISFALGQQQVLDEIVAIVADKIVLKSDIDGLVAGMVQQQRIPYSEELWHQALEQVIDQGVLTEHAKRDTNIVVTDDQIDQALDQRIDALVDQIGSTARLEELYGNTIIQIRAELRDEFRDQLLAEQFQSQKLRTIRVTPTEVRQWFAQFPTDSLPVLPPIVRVSHIVRYPTVSEEAEQEALDIVSVIRDSITTGQSQLEDMARRFSEDEGSVNSGGRYEDMQLGDLVPEFAAVASRSEPGELSQPFKSPFGYHILRVNERIGEVIDFNHILIRVDQSKADPADAIAYLELLRDSILTHNVPFEMIARRHSEEDLSSEIGGRVIDPNSGERDLFLEILGNDWTTAIDTLEVGELSHPAEVTLVNGRTAWHIVLLQRRVPEHRVDIETDYARIEGLALEDKRSREMRRWLDILREDVFIEKRGRALEFVNSADQTASGNQ